ncbi:tissue inhibitor of metalloproteinase-like [Ctenocephalides felis]|nr:tissue inhibitor of metalloproteinase-like [Ctenocephalides felis]
MGRWSRCLSALILVLALGPYSSDACSCMPMHPQEQFCKADYVIVARVMKRHFTHSNDQVVYKLQILQEYKMSEKAPHYLKSGRLVSSSSDSMCGVQLQVGETYVIMGRNRSLLSLCDFYRPYRSLTTVMKRGILGMYAKGCQCPIKTLMRATNESNRLAFDSCKWNFLSGNCEGDYGICIRREDQISGRVTCHWRRNSFYKKCKALQSYPDP